MLRDDALPLIERNPKQIDLIIHIYLSRLGISFEYDTRRNIMTSREYPNMCISEDQWFGTLTGLTAALLLRSTVVSKQEHRNNLGRKLIVPFGQVHVKRTSNTDHQTVTIERTASMASEHHYFVFTLNDRLGLLQSTDSPVGWLYLSLLHALTSHPLPDQYTGMTGMERAFQLLHSAGCWTDQPYDSLSMDILRQIALISPRADYYPTHLTCMERIDWNSHGIPFSLQHFGYHLIVRQLIVSSQRLNFMYPTINAQKIDLSGLFEHRSYNENLLGKLYWDYRDSYNPTARLSKQMEADILGKNPTYSYQPIPPYNSTVESDHPLLLADDLYKRGNVQLKNSSELQCFPLNRWLTGEYDLKSVWIGLLKLSHATKIASDGNTTDDCQRLELLLDFLNYISNKCQIKPFYLTMLKTALKAPTVSLAAIEFPAFGSYENIEHVSVQRDSIPFGCRMNQEQRDPNSSRNRNLLSERLRFQRQSGTTQQLRQGPDKPPASLLAFE